VTLGIGILLSHQHPVLDPLSDRPPAVVVAALGTLLLHHLPGCALIRIGVISVALAVTWTLAEYGQDVVDDLGRNPFDGVGRDPRFDRLAGVAIGSELVAITDVNPGRA
jgi:hypothetical protein